MTPTWAVLATMAVLTAAGALPVRMLVGWRPATPFMAPLGGAVLAGIAGLITVFVNGTELGWFVPLAIGANAAATASWLARREARRTRTASGRSRWLWVPGGAGVLGVAGATVWSLRSLVSVDIGYDSRSIWFAHATWIAKGHKAAFAALVNPGLTASHSTYPPLGGSTVALGWVLTGLATDRVGQLVLGLLTGCAVAAAGATFLEVGMIASQRWRVRGASVSKVIVIVLAAAVGTAWVLGVYGLAGAGATNGYVDLLWSAAAVGAAGMGLVLPFGGEHARAAAVLAVAAGMTKDEGIGAAVIIFALIALRWLIESQRKTRARPVRVSRRRALVALAASGVGAAGALAWPVAALLRHATSDDNLSGHRIGSFVSRAHATWDAMTSQLHLAGLALVIGIVAAVVIGSIRNSFGFGSDAWIWVLGVTEVVGIGAVYVFGFGQVDSWLSASAGRTALFANCLGLALLGWWAVIGAAAALAPGEQAEPGEQPSSRSPGLVDAPRPAVLHPGS